MLGCWGKNKDGSPERKTKTADSLTDSQTTPNIGITNIKRITSILVLLCIMAVLNYMSVHFPRHIGSSSQPLISSGCENRSNLLAHLSFLNPLPLSSGLQSPLPRGFRAEADSLERRPRQGQLPVAQRPEARLATLVELIADLNRQRTKPGGSKSAPVNIPIQKWAVNSHQDGMPKRF